MSLFANECQRTKTARSPNKRVWGLCLPMNVRELKLIVARKYPINSLCLPMNVRELKRYYRLLWAHLGLCLPMNVRELKLKALDTTKSRESLFANECQRTKTKGSTDPGHCKSLFANECQRTKTCQQIILANFWSLFANECQRTKTLRSICSRWKSLCLPMNVRELKLYAVAREMQYVFVCQ